MIFARKMPEFYIENWPKNFSRILGGMCPPPFSYAYAYLPLHLFCCLGGVP